MNLRTTSLLALLALGAPMVALAAGISGVADDITTLINDTLVPLIFAIAFIVFLYGIARKYIFSHGDPAKVSEGHKLMLWGLIGFVIMLSIWGLVNLIDDTFGLSGADIPDLPQGPTSAT